jgi:hypothetical protein
VVIALRRIEKHVREALQEVGVLPRKLLALLDQPKVEIF